MPDPADPALVAYQVPSSTVYEIAGRGDSSSAPCADTYRFTGRGSEVSVPDRPAPSVDGTLNPDARRI